MNLIDWISRTAALGAIARGLAGGKRVVARGSQGSSSSLAAGALARKTGRPLVLVVGHLDEADETVDELSANGAAVIRFPALETLPGESSVSPELFSERLAAVRRMMTLTDEEAPVIVCPVQALMQPVPNAAGLEGLMKRLEAGTRIDPAALLKWLVSAGYERVDAVDEPGQCAQRGDIFDIFPSSGVVEAEGSGVQPVTTPVRVDFFDDVIERITEIDLGTMASDRVVRSVQLVSAKIDDGMSETGVSFLTYVPRRAVCVMHEPLEITEQARGYFERLTDARVFGPPAVIKLLQERFGSSGKEGGGGGFVEIAQFSSLGVGGDEPVEMPLEAAPDMAQEAAEAVKELLTIAEEGTRVLVACQNTGELARLTELVGEAKATSGMRGVVEMSAAYVHRGFVWDSAEGKGGERLLVMPYHEMLHRFETRRRGAKARRSEADGPQVRAARAMDTFLDFGVDDYVVHQEHGIAVFRGLVVMKPREVKAEKPVVLPSELGRVQGLKGKKKTRLGEPGHHQGQGQLGAEDPDAGLEEYLTLEFAQKAKLHVPASKIDQVQKYVGGFRGAPQLSAIGGMRWKKQKESVSESVKDLAGELLRVRAARESTPGVRYPADTAWQREFEAEFPFQETEDQLAAVSEIKKDMARDRPMDRLLCGDVGFGKTEVAMRAAFKAVEFGKQVAVLVPTTVLAEQHERTFRSRLADYPFKVESISRFKTTGDVNKVLAELRRGGVDVIIGTHRLLSKDVKFSDLGVVIIDEEQRFGVEHKERLLSLRMTVDVLTLSATPIPRTLHLSMLGLRDISNLTTAPLDRRAVVTEVIPYNTKRIQQALHRELSREGQVFFVHNRVHNIQSVADDIQKLAPEARIVIGHGQMPDGELEKVMLTFMRREADILVSTTIIESGIDIPTANTMFINDADRFGLAELHQLRGRVGRSKHRAYCYMLLSPEKTVAEKAVKRLKAIEEYSMLGAGFKIAMRDLEIRGAGNILGAEQSGHIAAVGYEMYCQLLDRAVKELKNEPTHIVSQTSVEIGVTGMIPKRYIPSDGRRMAAYRRIAVARTPEELATIEGEMIEAYGKSMPQATQRLLELAHLRVLASGLHVRGVAIRDKDVLFRARPEDAAKLGLMLSAPPGGAGGSAGKEKSAVEVQVTVLPPPKGESLSEVYFRAPASYMEPRTLLRVLRARLSTSA